MRALYHVLSCTDAPSAAHAAAEQLLASADVHWLAVVGACSAVRQLYAAANGRSQVPLPAVTPSSSSAARQVLLSVAPVHEQLWRDLGLAGVQKDCVGIDASEHVLYCTVVGGASGIFCDGGSSSGGGSSTSSSGSTGEQLYRQQRAAGQRQLSKDLEPFCFLTQQLGVQYVLLLLELVLLQPDAAVLASRINILHAMVPGVLGLPPVPSSSSSSSSPLDGASSSAAAAAAAAGISSSPAAAAAADSILPALFLQLGPAVMHAEGGGSEQQAAAAAGVASWQQNAAAAYAGLLMRVADRQPACIVQAQLEWLWCVQRLLCAAW
jgi:hypothetical protein